MAKRKLYGAALKAHLKKVGRSRGRVRRNPPPDPKRIGRKKVTIKGGGRRIRHYVKNYGRKGGGVKSYRRGPARVPGHWSNPRSRARRMGYRRNPNGVMGAGMMVLDLLIGATVALVALKVASMANEQARKFPAVSYGYPMVLTQVALAGGLAYAAHYLAKTPKQHQLANAASIGFAIPALSALVMQALPQAAPFLALPMASAAPVQQAALQARLNAQLNRALAVAPGPRISDYTIDAQMGQKESDSSMF